MFKLPLTNVYVMCAVVAVADLSLNTTMTSSSLVNTPTKQTNPIANPMPAGLGAGGGLGGLGPVANAPGGLGGLTGGHTAGLGGLGSAAGGLGALSGLGGVFGGLGPGVGQMNPQARMQPQQQPQDRMRTGAYFDVIFLESRVIFPTKCT